MSIQYSPHHIPTRGIQYKLICWDCGARRIIGERVLACCPKCGGVNIVQDCAGRKP